MAESFKRFFDTIKFFFLPTSTKWFIEKQEGIDKDYEKDINKLERNKKTLTFLFHASRSKRMELLDGIYQTWQEHIDSKMYGQPIQGAAQSDAPTTENVGRVSTLDSDIPSLTRQQEERAKEYLDYVKATSLLREYLDAVEQDLENFKFIVQTQTAVELTGYRGLGDWGKTMQRYTGSYAKGLAALSIAGAGLVCSTIFGASRGDVILISYTFPLFTVGFLIPGFVYTATSWASTSPKKLPFASQRFWTALVFIALFVATVVVISAIVIINVTILLNPRARVVIRKHTFSEVAGIFSLVFTGTVIAVSVAALFLGFFSKRLRTTSKKLRETSRGEQTNTLNTYNHV